MLTDFVVGGGGGGVDKVDDDTAWGGFELLMIWLTWVMLVMLNFMELIAGFVK